MSTESTSFSDSQWKLKKALFLVAIELPIEQRETFLDSLTVSESTRDDIRRMLECHEAEDSFLQSPFDNNGSSKPGDSQTELCIGQSPAGFTIEALVGWGGMGSVYRARQENPNRNVALKVLNSPTRHDEHRVRRFEHEVAILARLDHPSIARIFSAGSFDFGRGEQPWYAMEWIGGQTLSQFMESQRLETRDKIEILIQICEAVQHAHERGVIHRDLKPSNILVLDPSSGRAGNFDLWKIKIVDFGIARLLSGDELDRQLTLDGEILGTLSYMSPEQICRSTIEIDARSDVFSIGMIGFELLSGRLPYERRGSSLSEIVSRAGRELPLRLRQFDSSLSQDLEAVFDAALQPDPTQRYLSAANLAADLQRCLVGERPRVRPPSMYYRMRRFVSNHRSLVVGTVATILALCIGLFFYASEARRVAKTAEELRYEVKKSQAINEFVSNDLIMRLIGSAEAPHNVSRVELNQLVEQATERIDSMFGADPVVEAAIRNEVGTIFYNLRMMDRAIDEYSRALELWERELGSEHNDTLKAMSNLGQTYLSIGKVSEAEPLLKRALEERRRTLGDTNSLTLNSMGNVASFYSQAKRLGEAEQMYAEVIAIKKRLGQESDKTALTAMANLGGIYIQTGRLEEALQIHLRGLEIGRQSFGEGHPTTLSLTMRAAQTLHRVGRNTEAAELVLEILPKLEAMTGSDSLEVINGLRLLSRIDSAEGRQEQALKFLQRAELSLRTSNRDPELLKKVQTEIENVTVGND